jgi:anti-anti-sigma regulatory factor
VRTPPSPGQSSGVTLIPGVPDKKDGWIVNGVIDTDGAPAFGAILRTLLRQSATVRLLCRTLDFFDASGMTALADAAAYLPDRKVVLEGTDCWCVSSVMPAT